MEGYQWVGGKGRVGEKVQGIRSTICRYKNRQGKVKNSIGNGGAKELIRMTRGHELRWGNDGGSGYRAEGNKEKKNGTTVIA